MLAMFGPKNDMNTSPENPHPTNKLGRIIYDLVMSSSFLIHGYQLVSAPVSSLLKSVTRFGKMKTTIDNMTL